MQIGSFNRTADGYAGHVHTLTLDVELTLVPVDHADTENVPDYRIHLGPDGAEAGAGWKRTGEKAGDYVALLIDDPALTQPIRANLFQAGKTFALLWNRPAKRDDKR